MNYLLAILVLVRPENFMIERLHRVAGIGAVKAVTVQDLQGVQNPTNSHPWMQKLRKRLNELEYSSIKNTTTQGRELCHSQHILSRNCRNILRMQ